jgi:hypothetical protein
MDDKSATNAYEAPRIEDHGDLTELTAAGNVGGGFDGEYTTHKHESTKGHLEATTA